MAGKDGSTWHHGYVPTNAAAVALKMHRKPGGGGKGATGKQSATGSGSRAAGAIHPGLSASYISGKGATEADKAELARRYQMMHGRPPTARQLAKIKMARPAKAKAAPKPKSPPKMKTQAQRQADSLSASLTKAGFGPSKSASKGKSRK